MSATTRTKAKLLAFWQEKEKEDSVSSVKPDIPNATARKNKESHSSIQNKGPSRKLPDSRGRKTTREEGIQTDTLNETIVLCSSEKSIVVPLPAITPVAYEAPNPAKLFALLIGINDYNGCTSGSEIEGQQSRTSGTPSTMPKFNNLTCAVSDAQKFETYLLEDLKVPGDRITFLRDSEATRDKIIVAFKNLAKDERIAEGDAIFIFYAGHGLKARPPSHMTGPEYPETIELLVPSDFNRDPNKYQYMAIPDYTMAALLNNVSSVKGDNITIIFDCCHSASALRGPASHDSQIIVRTQNNPTAIYQVPNDLDNNIIPNIATRGRTTPTSLKFFGTSSYVFFSACASTESAVEEVNKGGRFSNALLSILKKHDPNALTCSEIIRLLPLIDGQHPECEGVHKNRPLFQSYVPSNSKKFLEVREGPRGDLSYDFIIQEGEVHGLTLGDELAIFESKSKEHQEVSIGSAIIVGFDVLSGATKLKAISDGSRRFPLPRQPAPALLRWSNKTHLTLYVDSSDDDLNSRVRRLLTNALSDVVITYNPGAAQIGLCIDSNRLRFDVLDSALGRRNVKLLPRFAFNDDATLRGTLQGLSHYYWHLRRTSKNPLSLDQISISFLGVKETLNLEEERFTALTDSPNWIDASGCIDLVVDDSNPDSSLGPFYGFQLKHTASENPKLYPVLLYFDNVEFTITYAFNPAIGSNPEAPWSHPVLRIGYGSGVGSTVSPFSFVMNSGYDIEAGFFKLFLSNKPVDLDNMLQEVSPFTALRGMKQDRVPIQRHFAHQWAEKTFAVIMRRA